MSLDCGEIGANTGEIGADAKQRRRPRRRSRAGKTPDAALDRLDGRTVAARRARELLAGIESDLGHDLTVGARQLATRSAMLGALCEDFERRWISGEEPEVNEYLAAVGVQRRCLTTLGIEHRVSRDVTTLSSYLAARADEARRASPQGASADAVPSASCAAPAVAVSEFKRWRRDA